MRTVSDRAAGFTAIVVLAALVVVAGCTAPPPSVLPQPPGRGIVADQVVAASPGCTAGPGLAGGRSTITLPWQGTTRTATLDVPEAGSAPGSDPRPLLLSLHPFALPAPAWEAYSGLAAAAVARGYVVLSPFGSEPGPRWAVPGGLRTGVDDIGLLHRLVDDLEDTGCIDRNRIVAAGFSAGAAMAQALSCTSPWRFRAVAGSGGTNLTDLCPASPPTSVMILHGTADPIAPLGGSRVPFAPPLGLPVTEVVATDAARAGCDPTPAVADVAPTVRVSVYSGCGPHRVEYWSLLGSGHTWAGKPSLLDLFAGPTNTDVSANTVVLDFFDSFSAAPGVGGG